MYLSTKPESGGGTPEAAQALPAAPQKRDDAGCTAQGGDSPCDCPLDHGGGGRWQRDAGNVLNLTRQI